MKSHFQTTKLTTLADIQQDLQEEFEDNKGEIRIRKSKNRQHNGQKKKYNRTNNDLQNIHKKVNNIPPAINSFVFKLLRSSLQSDVNADEGHTIYWFVCPCTLKLIFSYMFMFCRSLLVLLYFCPFAIVLSVLLRFTDSDYPFGIFKLFLLFVILPHCSLLRHIRQNMFYLRAKERHNNGFFIMLLY